MPDVVEDQSQLTTMARVARGNDQTKCLPKRPSVALKVNITASSVGKDTQSVMTNGVCRTQQNVCDSAEKWVERTSRCLVLRGLMNGVIASATQFYQMGHR